MRTITHSSVFRFLIIAAFTACLAGFALFMGSRSSEARDHARADDRIPDHYIVVFKDGAVTDGDEDSVINSLASKHRFSRKLTYRSVFRGFSAQISADKLEALKADPRVAYISEDRTVSIDTAGAPEIVESASPRSNARGGGATIQAVQILPTGVNRIDAENKVNKGAGVNVAVIDTGIDTAHPDLAANIAGGKNCNGSGTSYKDGNGHGTHVAGVIAAVNNTQGVVGVAPGAKLWAVRVLNNAGSGTWSSVICGIDFVTSKAPKNGGPITVANMSFGGSGVSDNACGKTTSGPGSNDALHQAICRARDAGVTIVVAAGNSAADSSQSVPAAYDDAVITVSALADSDGTPGGMGVATSYGADDTFASFSNFGAPVDLGAPGVAIASTWPGRRYATLSGTSMASPHVAGASALFIASHPAASWAAAGASSWMVVRDGLQAVGELAGAGHTDSGLHGEAVVKANSL